jgi:hypothetical protein
MTRGHTTQFIVHDTKDGYFAAHLDNGWVRCGLLDSVCFDFPPNHPQHQRVAGLTAETVEEAHDEFAGQYLTA